MKVIRVDEAYQSGYQYTLTQPMGKNFDPKFEPEISPSEMLHLGIFGGDYFNSVPNEFPKEWFNGVQLSPGEAHKELNYFKVNASMSLAEWKRKGWISEEDPKGWFLWYCRYYAGRRIPDEDQRQITRWKNMRRHLSQIQKFCQNGDLTCRPRQRQALLHWAYDSRNI